MDKRFADLVAAMLFDRNDSPLRVASDAHDRMEHHNHGDVEFVEVFADAVHDKWTVKHAGLDNDFVRTVARRGTNFDLDRLGPFGEKLEAAHSQLIPLNIGQMRRLVAEQAISENAEQLFPIG